MILRLVLAIIGLGVSNFSLCHAAEPVSVIETAADLWANYNPLDLPLEPEVVDETVVDGVVLRTVRFTSEITNGFKVRIIAYYGFPQGARRLPAVLHLHGGGQNANDNYVKHWARLGYATLSINWGGRYLKGEESNGRTDWGPLPYEQNGEDQSSVFRTSPSPRENSWYHWAIAGRRAISFLASQREVNPERIGLFGVSMGGRLTWMLAGTDSRLRCSVSVYGAALMDEPIPGVEGSEYVPALRGNTVWRNTLDAYAYAPTIRAPFLFLSSSNDFFGRLDHVDRTLALIKPGLGWRVIAPHFSHHVPLAYASALESWMARWLKGGSAWPNSPQMELELDRVPIARVRPDRAADVTNIDVLYSTGVFPQSRHWRTVRAVRQGKQWVANLPMTGLEEALISYGSVTYRSGLIICTALAQASPDEIWRNRVSITDPATRLIDNFSGGSVDWFVPEAGPDVLLAKQVFFRTMPEAGIQWNHETSGNWRYFTRKVGDPKWRGAKGAGLALQLITDQANELSIIAVENYESQPRPARVFAAKVSVRGGGETELVRLHAEDFREVFTGVSLESWTSVNLLGMAGKYRFVGNHMKLPNHDIGTEWRGAPPLVKRIEWTDP